MSPHLEHMKYSIVPTVQLLQVYTFLGGFMEVLVQFVGKLLGIDVLQWIGAITAVLSALIGLFLLIPGPMPERQLQWLLDLLKKLSLK